MNCPICKEEDVVLYRNRPKPERAIFICKSCLDDKRDQELIGCEKKKPVITKRMIKKYFQRITDLSIIKGMRSKR